MWYLIAVLAVVWVLTIVGAREGTKLSAVIIPPIVGAGIIWMALWAGWV